MKYPDVRFFRDWVEGEGAGLKCVSPRDLEVGLKACQNHTPLPSYTLCELDVIRMKFYCQKQDASGGTGTYEEPAKMDNYFCMSDKDRQRVLERCKAM